MKVTASLFPAQMDPQPQPYMLASLTRPHSEQLLQGLQLLRQGRELCDVVLRVGDAKIHAHKVVLASISPYFKAMFTGNLSEKENSEVEFQCIDEAALQVWNGGHCRPSLCALVCVCVWLSPSVFVCLYVVAAMICLVCISLYL